MSVFREEKGTVSVGQIMAQVFGAKMLINEDEVYSRIMAAEFNKLSDEGRHAVVESVKYYLSEQLGKDKVVE